MESELAQNQKVDAKETAKCARREVVETATATARAEGIPVNWLLVML